MQITATITLTATETQDLAKILGCAKTALQQSLEVYASAALEEYVTLFLGQKVFRRGADQQEYRLFLLIERALANEIPDEETVCRLFQTTATESRALLRRVMSKYQYQLKEAIDKSMKRLVTAATQAEEGGLFTVIINSANLVDELNRLLAESDGSLQPVTKKRGSVSTYEISASSHEQLKNLLGLAP